jgi:hypothetical protein
VEVSAGRKQAVTPAPETLTLKRHRDLEGLARRGVLFRRIGFALLGVIAVLGLLNVFGQHPSTATADAPAARLQLYAPAHLRGGLLFMARFRVTAKQDLKNATLVLDPGWTESITINTIEPSPTDETSDTGRLSLALGPIPAGRSFLLFMDFQVNPTNIGHRSQDVELRDGDTHIATIKRTVTIFP